MKKKNDEQIKKLGNKKFYLKHFLFLFLYFRHFNLFFPFFVQFFYYFNL